MRAADPRRLWLFPLAAILTAMPWVFLLKHEQAVFIASAGNRAASYLYFAGFICLLVAIITLVAMAEAKRPSAWTVAALVLNVAAVAMVNAVLGVFALADPVVASYYLSGHQDVGQLLTQLEDDFPASIIAWLEAASAIAVIGAVATGVATWRAGIARWSAVLLAAGLPLALLITPVLSWVGSALLLGAGGWIAWRTNRRELAAAETVGVEPLTASGPAR
jgi:hypothetical protein